MRAKFYRIIALLSIIALFACSDFPNSIEFPVFDVDSAIPLIDSTSSLNDAIKDTAYIKKSSDGNLSVSDTSIIKKYYLSDALKMSAFNYNCSVGINSQTEFTEEFASCGSSFSTLPELFSGIPNAPATYAIPASPSEGVSKSAIIVLPDNIDYAKFNGGNLNIILQNSSNLNIDFLPTLGNSQKGFVYRVAGNPDIFIPLNDQQANLPANQRRGNSSDAGGAILISLSGRTIAQGGVLFFNVHTNGSQTPIYYDNNSGLKISFQLSNQNIKEAKIGIEQKTFSIKTKNPFPDNASLNSAEIDNFEANINIYNNFPLSGNAKIIFPQLKNKLTGEFLSQNCYLSKKSNQSIAFSNNGNIFELVPDSLDYLETGGRIENLRANVILFNDAIPNSSKEIFYDTDSLKAMGLISMLSFNYAQGNSAPKGGINVYAGIKLDASKNIANANFEQLSVKDLYFKLKINNTANLTGSISGVAYLFDKNKNIIDTAQIYQQTVNPSGQTIVVINKKDLKSSSLPDSVFVSAYISSVPNIPFSAYKTDYVEGVFEVDIPLALRIKNGSYSDYFNFNITNDVRKKRENIDSGIVKFEVANSLPAQANIKIIFLDEYGNKTLELPKNSDFIINSAQSDNNGYSISTSKSYNNIAVSPSDIDAIFKSKRIKLNVNINAYDSNKYLRYRLGDFIRVKANLFGTINTNNSK